MKHSVPFAVALCEIHQLAYWQLDHLEQGEWRETVCLMAKRQRIMDELAPPRPETLRPLHPMLYRIRQLNDRLISGLKEVKAKLVSDLGQLKRRRRFLMAYQSAKRPPNEVCRYFDRKES